MDIEKIARGATEIEVEFMDIVFYFKEYHEFRIKSEFSYTKKFLFFNIPIPTMFLCYNEERLDVCEEDVRKLRKLLIGKMIEKKVSEKQSRAKVGMRLLND